MSCRTVITGCPVGVSPIEKLDEDEHLLELDDNAQAYDATFEDERNPHKTPSSHVSNTHRDLPELCVETVRVEPSQQQEYTYEAKADTPK